MQVKPKMIHYKKFIKNYLNEFHVYLETDEHGEFISLNGKEIDLTATKELQKWLDKAIKYMEEKK